MIKCCHLKIVAVSEGGQTVQVEIAVVTGLRVPYSDARIVVLNIRSIGMILARSENAEISG